jgi:hypothetical protein
MYLFFAGLLVIGLTRAPGALAVLVLTKIAPGVVGIWFVVRRQWRAAAWAGGVTVMIVAVSAAFAPAAWLAWFHFLTHLGVDRTGKANPRPLWL